MTSSRCIPLIVKQTRPNLLLVLIERMVVSEVIQVEDYWFSFEMQRHKKKLYSVPFPLKTASVSWPSCTTSTPTCMDGPYTPSRNNCVKRSCRIRPSEDLFFFKFYQWARFFWATVNPSWQTGLKKWYKRRGLYLACFRKGISRNYPGNLNWRYSASTALENPKGFFGDLVERWPELWIWQAAPPVHSLLEFCGWWTASAWPWHISPNSPRDAYIRRLPYHMHLKWCGNVRVRIICIDTTIRHFHYHPAFDRI